jgi:hypothetical protein
MSSVNLSNESPTSTTPSLPRLPIPFNPVADAATIAQLAPNYTPVSPQTAVNILATQPDLNETVHVIAYGLVSTVHRREVAHALETKERDETNRVLQEKLKKYAEKIDKDFFLPGCPNGYEPNDGCISTLIPVGEGFFVPAKFVKLRDDGRVLCLPGKEHHEDPYAVDLFLTPDYSSQDIAKSLPIWFNTLLNGPSPAYHTLRCAVADLDDWNATAEIERYHQQDDRLRHLHDELTIIQAEVHLAEDNLAACRYRIEATRIPSRILNLEGRAWSENYPAHRRTLGRGAHRGPGGPNLTPLCTHASESYVLTGHESALFHISHVSVSPRFPLTRSPSPSSATSWLTRVLLFSISCGISLCSI